MVFFQRFHGKGRLPVLEKVIGTTGRKLLKEGDRVGVLEMLGDKISRLGGEIYSSTGTRKKRLQERLGDIYYVYSSLSSDRSPEFSQSVVGAWNNKLSLSDRQLEFLQRALNEYESAGCSEKIGLIKKKISELNDSKDKNK